MARKTRTFMKVEGELKYNEIAGISECKIYFIIAVVFQLSFNVLVLRAMQTLQFSAGHLSIRDRLLSAIIYKSPIFSKHMSLFL